MKHLSHLFLYTTLLLSALSTHACQSKQPNSQEITQKQEDKKGTFTVVEIDNTVPADSILQVIAKPYRGKVVLIDVWNTWCQPCLRAMVKVDNIKSDMTDVAYIYIADESSPLPTWKEMIQEIPGIHARITKQQSVALARRYQYPGIPTYFIIDKEGNIAQQFSGFPGEEKMRELLTEQE